MTPRESEIDTNQIVGRFAIPYISSVSIKLGLGKNSLVKFFEDALHS